MWNLQKKSEALVDVSLKKKQIFEGTIYLRKSREEYQKLKKETNEMLVKSFTKKNKKKIYIFFKANLRNP